jgi:MFS family permease
VSATEDNATVLAGGTPGTVDGTARRTVSPGIPYLTLLVIGLGGLFAGVTGPLLSTFIPPLVRDTIGDRRTLIGIVMAIDNVLLLALVPLAGLLSDRAAARGRSRRPFALAGIVVAAAGMAVFPSSPAFGIAGVIAALVLLYSGINLQRSPIQALVADLVPSRYRSLATGSITFQMCVGAVVFLMLGRMLGMQGAFLIAGATSLVIALAFAIGVREPAGSTSNATEATYASLGGVLRAAVTGSVPGIRPIFAATFLLQLTFQTFSTWYALHAIERYSVRPEDAAVGFIAWALGGVVGALPAGFIGVRLGRRTAMLLGFGLMAASLAALDRAGGMAATAPLLALASAGWTLPQVNAYPLFVEPIPRQHRGALSAIFLLCMALAGMLGDPLNGSLFDAAGGYRPLFLIMGGYSALAFVAVLCVPRGAGEADTGADSEGSDTITT